MPDNFDLEEFVKRLQKQMDTLNLKAVQVAKETGVSKSALSLILRKERIPSTVILIRLAELLGVSIDYLVGKSDYSDLVGVIQQKRVQTLVREFIALPESDRTRILDMIALLKSTQNR